MMYGDYASAPASAVRRQALAERRRPSVLLSGFGAFAIGHVVRSIAGIVVGVGAAGAYVVASSASTSGTHLEHRQIVGTLLLAYAAMIAVGAVAAGRFLRSRGVRHAYPVAAVAGVVGFSASLVAPAVMGAALLLSAIAETATAALLVWLTRAPRP